MSLGPSLPVGSEEHSVAYRKLEGVNKRKRGENLENQRLAAEALRALIKVENADVKAKIVSFLTPCECRELSLFHSTLRTAVETS